MNLTLFADNLLNPPVLFFLLGVAAVLVKSDLEIPKPIPTLLALYLLFSIGMKGGVELRVHGIDTHVMVPLAVAIGLAVIVPVYAFFILRLKLDVYNAGAIAASYGSVSAVTFIAAGSFLDSLGVTYGGYMVAAMALMESPAIIIGVLLIRLFGSRTNGDRVRPAELAREALFNGPVFLLMGSVLVGSMCGQKGWDAVAPFAGGLFKGVLAFFLLDMGIIAARRLGDLKAAGIGLVAFAIGVPVANAALAIVLALALGLDKGDAFILTVLAASASYIAVPAVMRTAVPEASPSLYIPLALAITFPFNIVLGLPAYMYVIDALWN